MSVCEPQHRYRFPGKKTILPSPPPPNPATSSLKTQNDDSFVPAGSSPRWHAPDKRNRNRGNNALMLSFLLPTTKSQPFQPGLYPEHNPAHPPCPALSAHAPAGSQAARRRFLCPANPAHAPPRPSPGNQDQGSPDFFHLAGRFNDYGFHHFLLDLALSVKRIIYCLYD